MVQGAYSGGSFGSVAPATSKARAKNTKSRSSLYADATIAAFKIAGANGLTSAEVPYVPGVVMPPGMQDHKNYSGVCSNLSRKGVIVRLTDDERNGSGVYVLPEFVNGRATTKFVGVADGLRARIDTALDLLNTPGTVDVEAVKSALRG